MHGDDVELMITLLEGLGWTRDQINAMTTEDAVTLIEMDWELGPGRNDAGSGG